ncbi:hypothetical protein H101_08208 [Trichophyton interdigitale H6]|nr:hypothetical protein H101_08208 [Trichophyton interdigitale H6]
MEEGYGGASTLDGMYFAKLVQDTLPSLAAVYFFGAYFITIIFAPGSKKNSTSSSRRSNVVIGSLLSAAAVDPWLDIWSDLLTLVCLCRTDRGRGKQSLLHL